MGNLTARLLDPKTFEEALKPLEALDKAATPGPWANGPDEVWTADCRYALLKVLSPPSHNFDEHMANSDLVTEFRSALPDFMKAIRELHRLLATAKAEGAAEAYEDIKAQAEDLRKAGGIRASLLRLLTEECASSAATIRKGLQVKEGK